MENNSIIIVGGGITGLAAAYILSKTNDNIVLVERGEKVGGLLATFEVGGNKLEYYYHHFFTHDKEINWLINDLNLQDQLTFRKTKTGVFRNGKIFPFNSMKDLLQFKPIGFLDKIRFGLTSLFLGKMANWRQYESVSAMDWFTKKTGKKATESIWAPLLKVKFGSYANKVPLAWMIGRLRQRMNSRKNSEEHLGYLNGSLNTLLNALKVELTRRNVSILTNTTVDQLIVENNRVVGVKSGSKTIKGSKVLITIPSEPAAKLIQPFNTTVASRIDAVKYFGTVCTILELDRALSDIYWLNVTDKGFPFGGIIEHTNFIPKDQYEGKHIAYLSRYFSKNEAIARMDEDEIKALMIPPLKKIYKEFDPQWIRKVHVFKTFTAATVCDLNFSDKVTPVKLPIENLYLANMMHIYPDERSVNNSIRLAAETAKVMGFDSEFVPKGNSLSAQIGF